MGMRIKIRFCIAFLVLVSASICLNEKLLASEMPFISLETAILFSLHESTKIKMAGERENQVEYSMHEAKSEYYPDVTLNFEAGLEYNDPAGFSDPPADGDTDHTGLASDINLSLRQMIFDKTKLMEVAKRKQLISSKSYETELVIEDVLEKTVNTYIDLLAGQKEAYLSAEMLVNMSELVEKIKFSFEAGGVSKARFDFATARLALAESKYNTAVSKYKDTVSKLEALIGPMPEFLVIEPDQLSVEDYDMNFYKHLAKKKNSELQLINSDITATKYDFQKQEATYLPKVDFVMELGQGYNQGGDVGRTRDATAVITVQYDLFKGGERKAAKKRILSRIKELEYEKQDLIKEITKNVKVSYNEIQGIKQTISAKLREVDAYLSLREIDTRASAEGEFDLFQSIENEEDIYDSLIQVFRLESESYRKSYSLLKLIGSLKKEKFCESC